MKNFNFGENLRQIRVQKGVSQDAMALKMNIAQTKFSRIERSKSFPDSEFIDQAAEFLGILAKDLMPADWDGKKKYPNLVCSLTRFGRLAYRVLVVVATYDITRGFCSAVGITLEYQIIIIGIVFVSAGVAFLYYTEKPV